MLRLSEHFPQTRRVTAHEQRITPGHSLLERGGFVRSSGAAGIFTLLPAGWRVHRKICDVIFEEMERGGVQTLQLPILQPRELWERSGRWETYVREKVMFQTIEEHRGTQFGLAPTAEEVVTALVAGDVKSWRELPLRLHQIGPKFRDEIRPRLGLLRCREFMMSDGYSFDRDEAGMGESFEAFRKIYTRIFDRLGLKQVISVQADSGPIGGKGSAEFMVVNDVGEDTLLSCGVCGYGANAEKADSRYARHDPQGEPQGESLPLHIEPTPGITTVEELQGRFPEIRAERMVKTLIFAVAPQDGAPQDGAPKDGAPQDGPKEPQDGPEGAPREGPKDGGRAGGCLVAVCVRGDLEVNEIKLANLLNAAVTPASAGEIEAATGAPVGFAGPIGLKGVREIHFDESVRGMENFLCGVNEKDVHALNVNFGRDVAPPERFVDVHLAKGGDGCPKDGCSGVLEERRGIEIGHVFMLQQRYSEVLDARYQTEDGREETMWMGSYGMGTTRLLQAIAEQAHDDDGLMWPAAVAPYDVHAVLTQPEDPRQLELLSEIEKVTGDMRLDLLADDRSASAGVKFKDADLLGCPVRVTIGRKAGEGLVEVKRRTEKDSHEMTPADLGRFAGRGGSG